MSFACAFELLVEWEAGVTGHGEVCVERDVHECFFGFAAGHVTLNLWQNILHKQYPINQHPIRRSLDLEIPEKSIRPKQTQDFIERIVGFMAGIYVGVCGTCGEGWELQGGAAGACAEGEEREVADEVLVGFVEEDGVVGGHDGDCAGLQRMVRVRSFGGEICAPWE